MEKFKPDANNDIVKESYKGPTARVAAAGQGFLDHLFYAAAGLVTGGIFAYIFHKPAQKVVESARNAGTRLKAYSPEGNGFVNRSKDNITTWLGSALHIVFGDAEAAVSIESLRKNATPQRSEWLANLAHDKKQGFGNAFLSHTIGLMPWVGMRFKEMLRGRDARTSTAIAFGGAAGALGYVGGWTKALFQGAKHGNEGKRQFERAKAEINALREKNQDLETINENLRTEYVEASSRKPAERNDEKSSANTAADASDTKNATPATTLHTAQHDGKMQPERAAEATPA